MQKNKPLIINHFIPESRKQVLPETPLFSSNDLPLNGFHFNYFQCAGEDTPTHFTEHHSISVSFTQLITSERKLDGIYQQEQQNFGSIGIIPASVEHCCIWKEKAEFAVFSIQPRILAQIAPETVNPDKIELLPTFAHSQDNLVSNIAIAIKQQLANDPHGCGFYLEHLFNALSAHLVKNYCSLTPLFKEYSDGLSPHKLRKALNYINDHLDSPIKLKDIAQLLDISQYYFCHMFKESIGISPYQYVIKQRVEKAKNLIRNSKLSLAEIAYECGFSSQSQMTQHFRKCEGVTPKVYFVQQKE